MRAICCALVLAAAPVAQEPVTIHLSGEAWFLNTLTKTGLIPNFERQTGIHVEVSYKDHQPLIQDLEQKQAGRPGYDVILMRHRFLGKLVEERLVQPIPDGSFKPEQQLFANWWRELSWYKGKAYGYPYTQLTTYLCYRKDLLENSAERSAFRAKYGRELTVPKSWDEYMQVSAFFTRPQEHFYGTYIQAKDHIALWYEFLNFMYSFHGAILDARHGDEYGDIVINSPENLAAVKQYLALIPFCPPDTLNYNWNDAQAAFEQARVFMGLLWSDQAPLVENPARSKSAGKLGYALIPTADGRPFSQLEGWTYLIPTESRHPHEAFRFLEWAMSPEVQRAETLAGGGSPVRATYDDPRVRALPFTSAYLASMPVAIAKPTIPESGALAEAIERGLSEIVTSKREPRDGLDRMAHEAEHILGGKARLHPTRP